MVSVEFNYLQENKEMLEKAHAGKYVAIYENKVVAVGKTIHEVYERVKSLKIVDPLIAYVPKKGEEALLI